MFPFSVLQLVLEASFLGFLVRVFARHNATNDMLNMVLVVGGGTIGGMVLASQLGPTLGWWILAVHAFLLMVLLITITGANPIQAALITGVFLAVKVVATFAVVSFLSGPA
jgi:hypothetical protein